MRVPQNSTRGWNDGVERGSEAGSAVVEVEACGVSLCSVLVPLRARFFLGATWGGLGDAMALRRRESGAGDAGTE